MSSFLAEGLGDECPVLLAEDLGADFEGSFHLLQIELTNRCCGTQ